jgi:hypothetical protein
MKVQFERTGGIAGFHDYIEFDTESISKKELTKIYKALEKTKFLRATSEQGTAVDTFHYKISIQKVVEIDGETKTARHLRPLIDLLVSRIPKHRP